MTAQIHEQLILDGNETSMAFCPPLPEPHLLAPTTVEHCNVEPNSTSEDVVYERWTDANGRTHKAQSSVMIYSTACWRGYIGTWEITNRKFFLIDLCGRVRLAVDGPLLADWFTGVLRIPEGEMLTYVHMGFGSVFEREQHIFIERGIERGRKTMRNEPGEVKELSLRNLPGGENRFKGDRDFH